MKVKFKSSFIRDLKRVKEKPIKDRVREAIELVERAPNLHEIKNLKKLKEASKRIKPLQGIKIKRLVNTDDVLIVICEKGNATSMIGRGGTIIKNLSKAMEKRVRVVEEVDEPKTFLEMLVYPVSALSISTVFRKEEEIFRIRVPKKEKLPISPKAVKEVFYRVFNHDLEVLFE